MSIDKYHNQIVRKVNVLDNGTEGILVEIEKLDTKIDEVETTLVTKVDQALLIASNVQKMEGKPGYSPIKDIDYFDGKDGESYILTDEDKKVIASSIEVPIVEKVIEKTKTVIRETPIVTEITKEVLPDDIAEKLNTLEAAIDVSVIKGAITRSDLDNQDKKVLEGMAKQDGRIKLIDQRWGGHGGGSTGGVTSVTATLPITSTLGKTPNISTSMNTGKLIGRGTAGVGVMEEIAIGTGLSLTGTTLNATAGPELWTESGGNLFPTTITDNVGIGTNTPAYKLDALGETTTVASPSVFTATLTPETLSTPGSDTLALVYGPRDDGTDTGSTQDLGGTGYIANCQSINATLYSYRNGLGGGIIYTSPLGINLTFVDTICDGTTPFNIQWNWSAETNGDGSGVDGYILLNNTTSYSYDVGNVTTFNDGSVTNFATYAPFAGGGAFTASGQTFNFDMFAAPFSPSGFSTYYNDNGNGYNITITDSQNNGSQFWISHTIASTGGNPWRELQQSNGFSQDGTGDQTYYQVLDYAGSSTVTPQHYGIVSDGTTFNRDYQAHTFQNSPSLYFSSGHTDASTVDPNDGLYYYITYIEANPGAGVRVLESINGGAFGGRDVSGASVSFYQDNLGGTFNSDITVTPTSISSTAGRFSNSSSGSGSAPQLILNSTAGSSDQESLVFKNNNTTRATISWNSGMTIDSLTSMIFQLGGTNRAAFDGGTFRLYSNTGFILTDAGASLWFYANQSNKNVSIGTNASGTARLQIGAGTATAGTAPLKINAGTLLTSAENGAIEHDTDHWYETDNLTRRMFITAASDSTISDGQYMRADASGRAVGGTQLLLSGGILTAGVAALFQQGLSVSSGKDISMSTGSRYIGGLRTMYATGAVSTSLNLANHSPIFVFTGSTSGRTLTLPTAASINGTVFEIKNDATVSVTVATTSAQTIFTTSAVSTVVLQPGEFIRCISDGTNWIAADFSAVAAASITGGTALTKTDDTNVTMTLGGAPTTALLTAASMTLGWTGLLSVLRGGTGLATATMNGVMLGNGTSPFAFTAAPSIGGVLRGNGFGVPAFGAIDLQNSNSILSTSKLPIAQGGTGQTTLLGAGIVTVTNTVSLTGQTADITTTNVATVAGLYRVSYSLQDTTADITAGAVVLTISYTDGAGSTTSTATQVLTGLGRQSGVLYIQLASGNLTYATSHTGLFGTATYALYITTERLL